MALSVAAIALGAVLSAAPSSAEDAGSPRWSMAVLPLSDRGVGAELAELVSETVAQEAHKLDGPRVIGMNEVKALLGLEAQKQMLGCAESGCMAEIAGALGVDKVLTGWVGKVGDSWLMNLKVIDVRTTAVDAQASERVSGGRGEEYLDLVGPMIQKLFPALPLRPGQTRGVATTLRARVPDGGRALSRRWAWAVAGTSALALGAGAAFGVAARSAQSDYEDLQARSLTEPVAWSRIQAASDAATSRAKLANAFYATGGVLGVGSAVLFLVTRGDAGATRTISVFPITGGAVASLRGSF